MKTYLARYWAVYGISLVAPALVACGDSGVQPTGTDATESEGSSSSTTMTPTSTSVPTSTTDDTTAGPTSDPSSDPSSSSTTSPTDPTTGGSTSDPSTGSDTSATTTEDPSETSGGLVCETILCGDPAVCCLADEECVDGECLPICPSGVRCGADQEICCDAGDVCVGETCTTPGGVCSDSYDCDPGEYCEIVLGNCLPQPDPLGCENVPTFDTVDVQLEWAHTKDEVIATPAIADVDGDGTPDMVLNTMKTGGVQDTQIGEIVLLDGATGVEKWRIPNLPNNQQFGATGRASLAVGDVSGDGQPDIVYVGRPDGQTKSAVHAVDGSGTLLWTSRNPNNTTARLRISNGAATLVNLDNDPQAEIAFGAALLDHDGLLVSNLIVNTYDASTLGSPHNKNQPTQLLYSGGISTFADVSGDGYPELIAGNRAFNITWANPQNVTLQQRWFNVSGFGGDGFPAVGDLDGNGTPEVVLTAWPEVRVLDGNTGKLWCGIDPSGVMCNNNDALRTPPLSIDGPHLGGPPTLADFDGDGRPEIGISIGTAYKVFDLNRQGEVIVKPMGDPMPAPGAIYVRWSQSVQDASGTTGSSVFDFQGDKKAEVLYEDECYARVYDGATGQEKLKITNSNSTIHEYPLVVDVDGDGNSEFVIIANLSDPGPNADCLDADPGFTTRKGIYVYGAGGDNWVPTRRVWTMHTYHVTNVESSGNVPMMELDNWTDPTLNNFRQNVQGAGVFNAADLTASLAIGLDECAMNLVLQATIYNEGALGVAAGVPVRFYEGTDNTGMVLGNKVTLEALLTGGSTQVELVVQAPPFGETRNYYVEVDGGPNGGTIPECNEDNNGAVVTDAECPAPG
jgi:hypothetical protein